MRKILVFSVFLAFIGIHVNAQEFIRELDIPVFEEDVELRNPWTGGINYVQYSKIDLNLDGVEDLFMFDKASGIHSTFINESADAGEILYKYAPIYEDLFPEGLSAWVLLRDYNCDGLKDIFTSGGGGFKLYEQSVEGDEISFTEVYSGLIPSTYVYQTPQVYPAFNTSIDLPHIGDIDGDGDVDILTASDGSLNVFFYINNASDLDRCDTLALELANSCYGFFSEASESNNISLGVECTNNVLNPRGSEVREPNSRDGLHAGGTLLSLETNGDGVPELVIGDVTNDSLTMLLNSNSVQGPDSMTQQFTNFPANFSATESVSFHEFPGLYHEDFNNDGIRDLAVSPFSRFNSVDDNSSWLYLNEGTEDFPDFQLLKKDWLQDEMIEHGTGSVPVIVDFNGDGLGDLVVSNEKTIVGAADFSSSLILYENTGTLEDPTFELIDQNWVNLLDSNLLKMSPAFGDIDGDGDVDMVLGENSGWVHLFENTAGPGNDMLLTTPDLTVGIEDINGEPIDAGIDASPQLVDLDGDGLLDLVIGENNGNINFYRNVGTETEFAFELETQELGGVFVESIFGIQGRCTPQFYKNAENEWRLVSGNELGFVQRWRNIEGNLEGVFESESLALQSINDGNNSAPCIYDINNDGYMDLFLGNERGGITLYMGQFFDSVEEQLAAKPEVTIYPNPSQGEFNLDFEVNRQPKTLVVCNLLGEILFTEPVRHFKHKLDLSELPQGIYLIMGDYGNLTTSLGRVIKE